MMHHSFLEQSNWPPGNFLSYYGDTIKLCNLCGTFSIMKSSRRPCLCQQPRMLPHTSARQQSKVLTCAQDRSIDLEIHPCIEQTMSQFLNLHCFMDSPCNYDTGHVNHTGRFEWINRSRRPTPVVQPQPLQCFSLNISLEDIEGIVHYCSHHPSHCVDETHVNHVGPIYSEWFSLLTLIRWIARLHSGVKYRKFSVQKRVV
jgi:hypothetical protein